MRGCTGFDWDDGVSSCRWRAELLKTATKITANEADYQLAAA